MVERPDEPRDPITELGAAAIQLHELFQEYVSAGFTRAEALQLCIAVLQSGLRGGQSGR